MSGDIAFRAKQLAARFVKPGVRLLDVARVIEEYIIEQGGYPAFPVNISINSVAAHRTPLIDDEEVIPEDSLVKVDIGVHYEGFIADTAVTLVLSDKYEELAEAVREALHKALKIVKPGVRFSDVGRVIESLIRKRGFRVIKNLSGHSLDRYLIHAGEVIPNFKDPLSLGRFRAWRAYAIEPFGTNGRGYVVELRDRVQIYALRRGRGAPLSGVEERILNHVKDRFRTLPFCERWLASVVRDKAALRSALNTLSSKGFLMRYPVLIEAGRGYVAQFEETVFITNSGAIVTTNPELRP